ncbi:hypothetical protein [Gelidibacter salicanalis]|uniref:Uncharacterized protein n=1 Tax=Gelidibacter salicanalis TaxID=291193 RepID=A0A934NDR5_9FLAO|nr:hypothetical protein [Gelidibacter salicanalis]MBJ7881970.1 hypothetical protein [Gelidibacter salicanalis]
MKHTLEMNAKGKGILIWTFAVRSLHNALIEDGFDKLENNFLENQISSKWSLRVKFVRKQMAKKRGK